MAGSPNTSGAGYPGQAGLWAGTCDFNKTTFLVQQILGTTRTATLVKILTCTNSGAVDAVGFVNVQPLVNLIDGLGTSSPMGIIHNVPYFRVQGGANAIICDPQVGDIGIALISDRDISSVKATKAQANPGSRRRFDMADALYIGGVINAVPTQYVQFNSDGIDIKDINENSIVMGSSGITINGVLFDRDKNVSEIAKLTTTDIASLAGGSKKVVLDGDTVVAGKVVASSTKTKAT